MRVKSRSALAAALVLSFVLAQAPPAAANTVPACYDPALAKDPLVIRVGVVAYDDYSQKFEEYKNLLMAVTENARRHPALRGRKVVFRLELGSYSDVFEWYSRDLVDLAFLTPTLIANLRTALRGAEGAGQSDAEKDEWADKMLSELYVASHDSASIGSEDRSALTHAVKRDEAPLFDYRAMAAVREDSPLNNYADLKREAEQGNVMFLFIDPLSTSGRVLPEYFLRYRPEAAARIENFSWAAKGKGGRPENSASYTFSPRASVEELSKPPRKEKANRHQVAFLSGRRLGAGLKPLSIPELEGIAIPDQALFMSHAFAVNKPCVEALFDVHNVKSRFQKNPGGRDWLARFAPVFEWVAKLNVAATDPSNHLVTLDQIADVLRTYESRYKRPARLALVLSGGGAKCAYQLGAIQVLETKLGKPPDREKGEGPVDIDLVVGTSGGAINALTVAVGLTREDVGGIDLLKDTWIAFNQRDFFSPWPVPYFVLGVCSGILQALLVLWAFMLLVLLARLLVTGWMKAKFDLVPSDLYRASGFVIALLALVNLFVWVTKWNGIPFGTTSHIWHHAWLLLTINTLVSGLCLAAIAALMILRVRLNKLSPTSLRRLHLVLRNVFAFGLAAVLALSLFNETTVSRSDGVDDALLEKLARVVDPDTGDEMRDALAKGSKPERFQAVSRIIKRELRRDLIITGSRLSVESRKKPGTEQPEDTQPSDLYFYYDHQKCGPAKGTPDADACDPNVPATDKRFKRFALSGDNLMDVVVGSSSIYPIFPARQLDENVKIIDGGFAHNSPIDAAVMWGATHIILIEASPSVRPRESRLFYNAMNAFNHLYYQAQLLDARARGKVEIFTLRPEPSDSDDEPDLCTFDFHSELVKKAIKRGYDDAKNAKPRFSRGSGEPVFKEVGIEEFTERQIKCPCGQDESVAAARPRRGP
jgi:predicted acylesterase/phospholipase RssA/ABC-type phosphate/phosphonate transport system substrate-binding protein